MSGQAKSRSVQEFEQFLYKEAALLDAWKMEEWFALFAPGASYEMPTPDQPDDVDVADAVFLIADDYERLRQRVIRMSRDDFHAEYPRPRCTRIINNVQLISSDGQAAMVRCAFQTYRSQGDVVDVYFGRHHYEFCDIDRTPKILRKRTLIGMLSIRPHGRVSLVP